jgi:pimeloyl-ACP methyl ester carboxylesterase
MIPVLAARHTVIAPDLRGVGGSAATQGGYDKAALAVDVHELLETLRLKRVYVVGHDIGGMVAYAYARSYAQDLLGAAVIDIPLAGIEPWDAVRSAPWAWHFGFHSVPGLPESLVTGRQEVYFRSFFERFSATPGAITAVDVKEYADAYGDPRSLKAGFEFYRAFPQDESFNRARRETLSVPILIVGGEHSGGGMLPALESGLRSLGVTAISQAVIPNCGHWIAEEQPQELVRVLEKWMAAI